MEHVLFFSASAEKSVQEVHALQQTPTIGMHTPSPLFSCLATFVTVRMLHGFYIVCIISVVLWLMM